MSSPKCGMCNHCVSGLICVGARLLCAKCVNKVVAAKYAEIAKLNQQVSFLKTQSGIVEPDDILRAISEHKQQDAKLQQAVAAERERVRREEVKPLIDYLQEDVHGYKNWSDRDHPYPFADEVNKVLSAVEQVQKENP